MMNLTEQELDLIFHIKHMTKEQKFKELLNIAIRNGFQINFNLELFLGDDITDWCLEKTKLFYLRNNENKIIVNDLVLETNFFECLFKDALPIFYTGNFQMSIIQQYKFQWMLEVEKGTALEWLFKQFNL